ncbi:MAG: radical SAM protein [Planctomycetaceae bacterium]
MEIVETTIGNVLTRTSGYLRTVTSHSLQPYRGCTFGNSLCGVGCYVQHSRHLLRGRPWGGFLEVRTNAADSYREHFAREARWARRSATSAEDDGAEPRPGRFSIFCSSATDPFVPQERRYGVTRSVLEAMCELPPDEVVLQTHSPAVAEHADLCRTLAERCDVRIHVSIESDRDRLPGLPPPAASVAARIEACRRLREGGLHTVVTVAPLLPIARPDEFFARLAEVADAVVLDHFIGGDGTPDGRRTRSTPLVEAMRAIEPESLTLDYRDRMAEIARRRLPGRVGVGIDGFAGRFA